MRSLLSSIVVVSLLACAPAAEAQWRAERPYRGLFAGGLGETEQLLTVSGSLGTGWDDNLAADLTGQAFRPSDANRQFRGGVSTASATLSYSLNKTAISLGASAGTTARYYPSVDDQIIRREYGSFGTSMILGGGFTAQADAVYQPYNMRALMPMMFEPRLGDPSIVDEDFPSSLEHYLGYGGNLGYTRRLSPRNTFSAGYNYRGREPVRQSERFARHSVGADLSYAVGRGLSLQFGYGYSEALYGRNSSNRYGSHSINANVNYNRALSFSRRTTLSFGTGSTASRRSRNDSMRFRANGSAQLIHEIGRTWSANAAYHRGLQFLESWPEPVFSDSAMAGIGGLVTNRVSAQLTARAIRGRGFQTGDGNRMVSYGAVAGLTFAVTRHINTGLNYSYYVHDFSDRVMPVPGLPDSLDRRSIRAFVSMWAPLFQTARRP